MFNVNVIQVINTAMTQNHRSYFTTELILLLLYNQLAQFAVRNHSAFYYNFLYCKLGTCLESIPMEWEISLALTFVTW